MRLAILGIALLLIGGLGGPREAEAQIDTTKMLLLDKNLQIEITDAVNNLYNFKYAAAEKEFRWLQYRYPEHPLPYFLLGLSEWWKIAPNITNEQYDDRFIAYMDSTIDKADALYDDDSENIEAAFFLAAAHGFKGRLYSERRWFRKATFSGRNAISYLDLSDRENTFGPEFLFGDALYNYYYDWIAENYPWLRSVLVFFSPGDQELGLKQLREVSLNAFYTRTEAQYFLMTILANDLKDYHEALRLSEYLHSTFPDNAYFHRYHARLLYSTGRLKECERVCLDLLDKLDRGMPGYEATGGRWGAFFLGYVYQTYGQVENSKKYYKRAVAFGEEIEAYESGYFLYSLLYLGQLYEKEGNKREAKKYYKEVRKHAKRNHPAHDKAKEYLKSRKL